MKRGLLLIWFLVNALTINAQNRFGNEWIRTDQKYLKFSITQAGIYRITYQDIKASDASLLLTNPVNWQVFFRGQEIAIRVVGQQDGVFDAQDYVEFYGEGNDGSQDSLLYRPKQRLHPYQTLFSDKAAYFLTNGSTLAGKRIPELNPSAQGLTDEPFHVEETVQAFTSEYTFNPLKGLEPFLQQSYYEPGEGWSGPLLTTDSVGIVQLKLSGRAAVSWPITLDGMVNGRDNSGHQVLVQQDTATLASLVFAAFSSQTFQKTINPATIRNEQLTLRFTSQKFSATNNFSITYVKLSYPQTTDMTGQTSKVFHVVPNTRQTALVSVKNAPAASIAYDITDKANCRYLTTQTSGDQTQIVVSEATQKRNILVTNTFSKPLSITAVRFSTVFPKATDYLIITHASVKQSAVTYANFRASDQGGNHQPFVIEADSLFDQFNFGERSPLALRRFADYMLANTAVKYLFLVGRANSYPYEIKTSGNDLVPTIGYPGSDILLTAGLNGYTTNTPALPTGRLNVTTNDQVLTYLAKVKQLESSGQNGIWRKHLIHISGGKTIDEAVSLRTTLSNLGTLYMNGQLGGQISTFSKSNTNEEVETINIAPLVNDGVSLITFFGHAGPAITDMNFGFASPPENGFRNKYYPLMVFNGCGVGEIFSHFSTLSTDWVLAPDKGSTLVLAHSYLSFEQPTARYLTKLYTNLFTDATTLGMPFGKVQQQVSMQLEKEGGDLYDVSVMLEMVLQGDPAVSVYPLPNPDYTIDQKGIYIQSSVAGSAIKNSDSIQVVIPLANLGKFVAGQSVSVSLKKTVNTTATTSTLHFDSFRYRDTLVYTLLKDQNLKRIDVTIDPANQVVELNKTNNTASLDIDWTQALVGTSYPVNALPDLVSPAINVFINGAIKENQAVVNTSPRIDIFLQDENPLSSKDTNSVEIYLKSCDTCGLQKMAAQAVTTVPLSANQLQATANLSLKAGGAYQLVVFGKDAAGNRTQPPYTLAINVLANDEPITLRTYPNPATTYAKFELTLDVQELPTESRLLIYNVSGKQVYEVAFPISTGKNSVLWQGNTPGLYVYSVLLTWKDGRTETYKGKLVWQN